MDVVRLPLKLREISHEFSNPLTGILGSAILLEDESLTPEERKCFTQIIIDAGNKLVELRDLLLKAKLITEDTALTNSNGNNK